MPRANRHNLTGTNKWFKVNHLERPNGWDKKDWLGALGQLAAILLFVSVSSILLSQTVRSWLFVRLHVYITFLMGLVDRCRNAHKYRSVSGGKLRKVTNPSRSWCWQYLLHMGGIVSWPSWLKAKNRTSWLCFPTIHLLLYCPPNNNCPILLQCASMFYYLDYWEAFRFCFLVCSVGCMGSKEYKRGFRMNNFVLYLSA